MLKQANLQNISHTDTWCGPIAVAQHIEHFITVMKCICKILACLLERRSNRVAILSILQNNHGTQSMCIHVYVTKTSFVFTVFQDIVLNPLTWWMYYVKTSKLFPKI